MTAPKTVDVNVTLRLHDHANLQQLTESVRRRFKDSTLSTSYAVSYAVGEALMDLLPREE
jgi:hypothetical protein